MMLSRLILMLKFPTPGRVKTRLAPTLGEARACALHRALVAHTLAEVACFAAGSSVAVEVRLAGAPDEAAARAWLGAAVAIREQGEGDLGMRMARAVEAAFSEGAAQVVVIGGDCPSLKASHLADAFAALTQAELVLGPAEDGGYYLIGLRRVRPTLFQGIAWGGDQVYAQTLAAAGAFGGEIVPLQKLRDVDVPADLAGWAQTPAARSAGLGGVSVIMPVLNEAAQLSATFAAVQRGRAHEVIVVDGGSADDTAALARAHDAIVLHSPSGRARQMNAGAAIATGEFLLFLHADTILPPDYAALVRATLARPGVVGGAFRFAISGDFMGRTLIERGTNWRARFWQMPYGDQGIFVRRETFERVGGFPELPIMEDYAFVRGLRRLGTIALASGVAETSGRRWRRLGGLRTTLRNQRVLLGYHLGVAPARLARWYRGE